MHEYYSKIVINKVIEFYLEKLKKREKKETYHKTYISQNTGGFLTV